MAVGLITSAASDRGLDEVPLTLGLTDAKSREANYIVLLLVLLVIFEPFSFFVSFLPLRPSKSVPLNL